MKQKSTNKMCDFPRSPSAKKIFAFEASVKIEKCEKNSVSTCIASPMRWCVHQSLFMQFNEQNLDETAFFWVQAKRRQAESGRKCGLIYSEFMDFVVRKFVNFSRLSGQYFNWDFNSIWSSKILDYFDDVFFWYITQWTMNWSDTTMNWTYLLRVELSIQQQWTEHDFCVYFDDTRENNELYFRNALFVKFSQVGGGLVSWHTFRDFELVTRLWREDF